MQSWLDPINSECFCHIHDVRIWSLICYVIETVPYQPPNMLMQCFLSEARVLMCKAAAWMMTLLLRGEGRRRRLMAELSAAGVPYLTRSRVICHFYTSREAAGRTADHDQFSKSLLYIRQGTGTTRTSRTSWVQAENISLPGWMTWEYNTCSIMNWQHSFIHH